MAEVLEPAPTRGRPRDSAREQAILDAALELVGEVGYDRVTMDAIAARARAGKATLYRRWCSKAALVGAAGRARGDHAHVLPDPGSLQGDLLAAVTLMATSMGEEDLALLTGVFAGMRDDPELADAMRCGMLAEKQAVMAPMFERAAARGDRLRADAVSMFLEVAPAVVFHRILVVGLPADEAFCQHVVDDVLLPVLAGVPSC